MGGGFSSGAGYNQNGMSSGGLNAFNVPKYGS